MSSQKSIHHEYETYCALPVSKFVNDEILRNIPQEEVPYRQVWVFYFADGVRSTGGVTQRKTLVKKSRFLYLAGSFNQPVVVPMCRTASIEEDLERTPPIETLHCSIIRYVLYKQDNIRICLEQRYGETGGQFYISGEVEYTKEESEDFIKLKLREASLVCELRETLNMYLNDPVEVYNVICVLNNLPIANQESIFGMPCRVFSKFHKVKVTNAKEFIYKHKFDGFKGKMVCQQKDQVLYQDDNINFRVLNTSILNTVPNLYLQIENMCGVGRRSKDSETLYDTIPTVIITDVLGIKMGGEVYMPEPKDVLKFLSTFNRTHQYVNFGDGAKQFLVQEAVPLNSTTPFKQDGHIIVYKNKEFKFKLPTFDVKLIDSRCYIKNANNTDESLNLEFYRSYEDGIYEVTFAKHKAGTSTLCNHLNFLRKRTDRLCPSTRSEIDDAINEFVLMRESNRV